MKDKFTNLDEVIKKKSKNKKFKKAFEKEKSRIEKMNSKKIIYSWEDFTSDINRLGRQYKGYKGIVNSVYGVPRGGLVPAVFLSHLLEVPLVLNVRNINRHTLVIDDICDTGATLKKLLAGKKYLDVVALWKGPSPKFTPTSYLRLKETTDWILFPWETLKSTKNTKKQWI